MAVDTAIKRASVIGVGSPVPRLLPVPSGTVGAAPRQMLAYLYAGILAGTPTVGEIVDGTVYLLMVLTGTAYIDQVESRTASITQLLTGTVES